MMSKDYFVDIITKAEILALENQKDFVRFEVKELERKSIDSKHLKELISHYMANALNDYEALKNYYKAAYEGYESIIQNTDSKFDERDRIDFISTMLISQYNTEAKNDIEKVLRKEFLKQMINLREIVVESYTLKLKAIGITKYLKSVGNKKKSLSATETAYMVYYLTESKCYKWINGSPAIADWAHFSSKHNVNKDNIRKGYNSLMKSSEIRLSSNRKNIIKNALNGLNVNYPESPAAIKLCETELNITRKSF